jgi:hypothetical protein
LKIPKVRVPEYTDAVMVIGFVRHPAANAISHRSLILHALGRAMVRMASVAQIPTEGGGESADAKGGLTNTTGAKDAIGRPHQTA